MRARFDTVAGPYWTGLVQAAEILAAVSALGAIGGLPALLSALTRYARLAFVWLLFKKA